LSSLSSSSFAVEAFGPSSGGAGASGVLWEQAKKRGKQ